MHIQNHIHSLTDEELTAHLWEVNIAKASSILARFVLDMLLLYRVYHVQPPPVNRYTL